MKAAIFRGGDLVVDTMPEPVPDAGQVLVKTLACGICGSDLHFIHHAEQFVNAADRAGSPTGIDLTHDMVLGHEFCAEVVDFGSGSTRRLGGGQKAQAAHGLLAH